MTNNENVETVLGEYLVLDNGSLLNSSNENILGQENEQIHFSWTSKNTLAFLDLYKKYRNDVGSFKTCNLKKLWETIASQLQKQFKLNVTPSNCENRWRVLERNYKRYIDNNKKTGRSRWDFQFSNEMNDIVGKKKSIVPAVVLSTDTIQHVPMISLTEAVNVRAGSNSPASTSTHHVETSALQKKNQPRPIRKIMQKNDILHQIKGDRQKYQEAKLNLTKTYLHDKLEMEKQKLNERRKRNELVQQRNDLLQQAIQSGVELPKNL